MRDLFINIFAVMRGIINRYKFKSCGSLLRIEKGVRIWKNNGDVSVGDRVFLHRHCKISAYGADSRASVKIGNRTYIGDRTEIHAGLSVEIGSGCDISWDCNILDRDYHKLCSDTEVLKPVKICDNVWIGCGATILKGVTIGRGSVVAAGGIVNKSTPPYSISGGVPARVIKFRFTIDEILEHERILYPENERYTLEELEKIFAETKTKL